MRLLRGALRIRSGDVPTPVVQEDLHFWAEVMLPWGEWLVIVPTPGYEVLGPRLPWSERLWAGFIAGAFLGLAPCRGAKREFARCRRIVVAATRIA